MGRTVSSAGELALSEFEGPAVLRASSPAQGVQSIFCDLDVIDENSPCPAKIPACLERLSFSPGLGFWDMPWRSRPRNPRLRSTC